MPYVAVNLKICDLLLQETYKGTHLLQVWHKGGKKVFELVHNEETTAWACYSDTLVYKPPKGEENDDCVIVVDLDDPYRQ
jgi:hypothetical protein